MVVIRGNPSTRSKTCPNATFVFHKYLIAWPGDTTGPQTDMKKHRLRHGTALLKAGNSSESYSRNQFLLHREDHYFHYENQSINAVYRNKYPFFNVMFCIPLLGVFVKLWKATISFVMSVRSYVRIEHLGYHLTSFQKIWYLSIFLKIFRENSSFIKIWQE